MRDGFRCAYCGKTADEKQLEVDHIVPRSKGGSNDLGNLVTSCFDCNRGKSAKTITKAAIDIDDHVEKLTEKAAKIYREEQKEKEDIRFLAYYFTVKSPTKIIISESGANIIKKYYRRFHKDIIMEAIDIATDVYLPLNPNNMHYENALNKVGGICFNNTLKKFLEFYNKDNNTNKTVDELKKTIRRNGNGKGYHLQKLILAYIKDRDKLELE